MNTQKIKIKLFNAKFKIMMIMSAFLTLSPTKVFADTTVGGDTPTIGDDGAVTFKGGDSDIKASSTNLLSNAQFVVGLIAALAGLCLLGFGIWYGWRAGKQIQEGNQQGWSSAGKVAAGTVVGGILIAVVGAILAIGAATGNSFFG